MTWSDPKCLRATVTYRDGINTDRTHAEQDNPDPLDRCGPRPWKLPSRAQNTP